MSNDFYTSPTDISAVTKALSVDINNINAAIDLAFDKVPSEAHLKRGTVNFAVDTGAADAYLVALPYVPSGYVDGLEINFRPINTNNGASTINVNSLGVKSLKRQDGSDLSAGDITIGVPVMARYSTATGYFHMSGNSSVDATATAVNAASATASAAAASASANAAASSATNALNSANAAAASAATVNLTAPGPIGGTTPGSGAFTTLSTTGDTVGNDQQHSRAMFKDTGTVFLDKGNSGTAAQALDYTAGSHQKLTVTGAFTLSTSNWPPTGNTGELLLELVNGASSVVTWPTVNWVKGDGTFTTTFASNGVTLQSSGTDFCLLWSRDGGTTVYGKWMR